MPLEPEFLRDAPETGFNGATFGFLSENPEGGHDDWSYEAKISIRHIPGSNKSIIQSTGMGPATATWRIYCDTPEEYAALLAKLLTTGTLTTLARMQSLRGTVAFIQDQTYEYLTDVTLIGVSNVQYSVDGRVEATCTFVRAINPITGGSN